MIFLLKLTRSLYNTFSGAMTPTQIAYGLCLGLFVALMPFGFTKLHTLGIIALVLFTRASIGLFLLTGGLVKPLAMAGLDSLCWRVGEAALEAGGLHGFWKTVLNLPVIALGDFDRYAVMGGFLVALLGAIVLFWPIRALVVYFREKVQPRADQYRIVRWWRGFWLTKALSFVFVGDRKS